MILWDGWCGLGMRNLLFNGNSRILKWRYVSTIFLAIFFVDIPWTIAPRKRPWVPEMAIDLMSRLGLILRLATLCLSPGRNALGQAKSAQDRPWSTMILKCCSLKLLRMILDQVLLQWLNMAWYTFMSCISWYFMRHYSLVNWHS